MKKLFIFLLFLLPSIQGDRYDDLAGKLVGHVGSVIETGELDKSSSRYNPNAVSTQLEAGALIERLIKAMVLPVDPLVQGLENLEKRLREKLDQIHRSMMEEIHYIANEYDVDDFLDSVMERSSMLSKSTLSTIKYNISDREVTNMGTLCTTSVFAPKAILAFINTRLINKCRTNPSSFDEEKFSDLMDKLSVNESLPLLIRSKIAYYATTRHKETLSEVLEHFWKEVERHSTEPLDMEEAYDKAISALGKERKKQGKCQLDWVFYGERCNRTSLSAFSNIIMSSLHSLAVGATICGPLVYTNNQSRENYYYEIDRELDSVTEYLESYYDLAMNRSHRACDSSVITETILQWFPSSKTVIGLFYKDLADRILRNLAMSGSPTLKRYVIVSRNGDTDRYLAICPETRCKIIRDYKRDLVVFVSVHEPIDSNIAENEEFFQANQKKIGEVIWEKQNSDYLTDLVTELENRNLSLTASNRFHTQVWVRHFTFVGDCLAQSSLTHNSPNEIHKYFTYHYRHRWVFWFWCEDIKIYILP